jgi:alkanesulfonate monooxygenase SsuD/methylene tetrahydromethanopterin reductase-like flavin-dependent oxidoreductase (luciferase family)
MTLPWHNPVLLAEQAATLDLVSDGRLDFGVGKGYRHTEFKGFGIAQEEAGARFDEALAVILRSWTTRTRFSIRAATGGSRTSWSSRRRRSGRIRRCGLRAGASRRSAEPPPAASISFSINTPTQDDRRTHRALPRRTRSRARHVRSDAGGGGASVYVARDEADKQAALARLAAHNRRLLAVSRAPDGKAGSHVLAYADAPGETERNALVGTPDEICRGLEAVNKAGAEYVLLTILAARSSCELSRARSCRRFPVPGHPLW